MACTPPGYSKRRAWSRAQPQQAMQEVLPLPLSNRLWEIALILFVRLHVLGEAFPCQVYSMVPNLGQSCILMHIRALHIDKRAKSRVSAS